MQCSLLGICGGCSLPLQYEEQLNHKLQKWKQQFASLKSNQFPSVYTSPCSHFRARAEFRIFHDKDHLSYALTGINKERVLTTECPILLEPIQSIFHELLDHIKTDDRLSHKLFSIEFLSTLSNELLITLLYHKPLNDSWQQSCHDLIQAYQGDAKLSVIGRSRAVKYVIGEEYVLERFMIKGQMYQYRQYEGAFSQPNPFVNIKMIEWVCYQAEKRAKGDLLELYCGLGNFTLPLSRYYQKVLATEISKTSLRALKENLALNDSQNIQVARMSATEVRDALLRVRAFNRLSHLNLDDYVFSTLFVDPPRAGLGADMLEFAKGFEYIIYVSCNPETLFSDLAFLLQTHDISDVAVFDQFPYTLHLESAVWLTSKTLRG